MISAEGLMEKELPDGWQWKTMGEIAEVVSGGTPRTSDSSNFDGGDIPWITPADLSGYTAKHVSRGARLLTQKGLQSCSARLLPEGTVLFTSRAPVGYVAIASNPIATNQGFKSFVLREGVLPDYAYWWLKGAKQLAESLASGTTFLELSGANAKKLPIPIAPFEEQRRIVAEIEKQFSRLDEAVANLQRVKANLKRYKAAVLKAAVEGRLVETEAELARREGRSYETGEQLLQRILEERRTKWAGKGKYKEPVAADAEGLHGLPYGWTWCACDQISEKITDGEHISPKTIEQGIPLLSAKDVLDTGVTFEDAKYVAAADSEKFRSRCNPDRGDVLIVSRGATIGRACLVNSDREFCLMGSVILMKPDVSVNSAYLLHALKAGFFQARLTAVSGSTAQQAIYIRDVRPLQLPLPPLAEQARIVAEVDRCLSIVREVEAEVDANLQRAQALRQSVLQRVFAERQ